MPIVNAMLLWQSRNVRTLQHPATIAAIILARPPLGSLVVRLIRGDAIRISGVGHLCVAIQSLLSLARIFYPVSDASVLRTNFRIHYPIHFIHLVTRSDFVTYTIYLSAGYAALRRFYREGRLLNATETFSQTVHMFIPWGRINNEVKAKWRTCRANVT